MFTTSSAWSFWSPTRPLSQASRRHFAGVNGLFTIEASAADERLLRLDWAVRAGRLALADRAAQGLTSMEVTAKPWLGKT